MILMKSRVNYDRLYDGMYTSAKHIVEILAPKEEKSIDYGSNMDGKTEMELIGNLHHLTICAQLLDSTYVDLMLTDPKE